MPKCKHKLSPKLETVMVKFGMVTIPMTGKHCSVCGRFFNLSGGRPIFDDSGSEAIIKIPPK